jgi:hypothetical protein
MYTNIDLIQDEVSYTLRHFVTVSTILEGTNTICSGIFRGVRKSEWTAIGAAGFLFLAVPL